MRNAQYPLCDVKRDRAAADVLRGNFDPDGGTVTCRSLLSMMGGTALASTLSGFPRRSRSTHRRLEVKTIPAFLSQ
jgi:hypothetical protein